MMFAVFGLLVMISKSKYFTSCSLSFLFRYNISPSYLFSKELILSNISVVMLSIRVSIGLFAQSCCSCSSNSRRGKRFPQPWRHDSSEKRHSLSRCSCSSLNSPFHSQPSFLQRSFSTEIFLIKSLLSNVAYSSSRHHGHGWFLDLTSSIHTYLKSCIL